MHISKKIAFGLFCASGLLFSTAAYLDKGIVSLLTIAGIFVCAASVVIVIGNLGD